MISSSAEENGWTQSIDCLLSPPRKWPAAFKENKTLSAFLNKTLKAKKARLTEAPPAEIAEDAKSLGIFSPVDSIYNAAKAEKGKQWPTLKGFAIFELEDSPDVFVAREHEWNMHPNNIWVDLTPRPKHHKSILLVEADVEAAYARAGIKRPQKKPPEQPKEPPPQQQQSSESVATADATSMMAAVDVSDAGAGGAAAAKQE